MNVDLRRDLLKKHAARKQAERGSSVWCVVQRSHLVGRHVLQSRADMPTLRPCHVGVCINCPLEYHSQAWLPAPHTSPHPCTLHASH